MIFILMIALLVQSPARANTQPQTLIDPALRNFAITKTARFKKVVILFEAPSEKLALPRQLSELTSTYKSATQNAWKKILSQLPKNNPDLKLVAVNWINLSATVWVNPSGLKKIAQVSGIKKIYATSKVSLDDQRSASSLRVSAPPDKPGYNFETTRLNQLIGEEPGIDGTGVLLGSLEAGIGAEQDHPALAGKEIKYYDMVKKTEGFPENPGSHATHTSGIMVGGNRSTIPIGVAPGARFIQAGGDFEEIDTLLIGMQYLLEPELSTEPGRVPIAINNSWNSSSARDQEVFYRAVEAWSKAGIIPVFSAGNFGPGASSITRPHEHPDVLTVGATGANGLVTDYSSRGPADYEGQPAKKPDLVAPGDQILSSLPEGDYGTMDGTSMAAPHVVGAIALIAQAAPKLTAAQIKDVLLQSLTPSDSQKVGEWDPAYGYGKLDIYAAVELAQKFTAYAETGAFDLSESLFSGPLQAFFTKLIQDGEPRVYGRLFEESPANADENQAHGWLTFGEIWR